MYFDQRGPLVLSASLHFAVLVALALFAIIKPFDKREEFQFELVAAAMAAPAPANVPVIQYESEPLDLPKPEEFIETVELEPLETPPDPVPEPPVQQEKISFDDFVKEHGPVKPQNISRSKPKPQQRVDLSRQVESMTRSLQDLMNTNLPQTKIDSLSSAQQDALASYFAQLKQRIKNAMETHPLGARSLQVVVQFDLAPTGRISNAKISRGSGDPVFDQKALDAFKKVPFFGAPPGFTASETLSFTIVQAER